MLHFLSLENKTALERVANVVVCSRTQNEIDSEVKEIENVNSNQVTVLGLKCDVSVSSDVNYLVQSAVDKFGQRHKEYGF